jgi:hypothetical protein
LRKVKADSGNTDFLNMTAFIPSLLRTLFLLTLVFVLSGCSSAESDSFSEHASAFSRSLLYVASGSCYAGGVATSAGSSTVVAYDLNGMFHHVVVDYNSLSPGDSPVGIVDFDANNVLILVENTSGRRIDLVRKDGGGIFTYLSNTTALSAVVRRMTKFTDGGLLVSKTSAIERFSSGKSRILQSANPYINAPAGSCATSTTLISGLATLSNGKILFSHAAATPNNKIALISSTGYAALGDCISTQAAPTTLAMPTALLYHSSGKVIAAYASTTMASNLVYAYDINESTGAFSGATASYTDASLVNGPSAMAENPMNGDIFIANGNSTYNNIERFTFDRTTKLLTRIGSFPFIPMQVYTRCVSDMKVISQ